MIESISAVAGNSAQRPAQGSVTAEKPAEQAPETSSGVYTAPINPRLRFDAPSGVVVTEFLKNGEDVQSQVPSAAALAYLRAGLQADGLSKTDIPESSPSTSGE